MAKALPSVFVGSSSERADVIVEINNILSEKAYVVGWRLAAFAPDLSTLQNIKNAAEEFDFGIFIFGPDDVVESRENKKLSTRDNVIFEYGLFLGAQGLDRTFAIVEQPNDSDEKVKIPSDLEGVQIKHFSRGNSHQLKATLQGALSSIAEHISKKGRWQRRFGLRKSWRLDGEENMFYLRLSGAKIQQRLSKLNQKNFCLVCMKENSLINIEDDECIAIGEPRQISSLNPGSDIKLRCSLESLGNIASQEKVLGHLLLVPTTVDVRNYQTISQMLDAGCELLDSVGWSQSTQGQEG